MYGIKRAGFVAAANATYLAAESNKFVAGGNTR